MNALHAIAVIDETNQQYEDAQSLMNDPDMSVRELAVHLKLVEPALNDAFKKGATVRLLEYIGSPQCMALAKRTRERWKIK